MFNIQGWAKGFIRAHQRKLNSVNTHEKENKRKGQLFTCNLKRY